MIGLKANAPSTEGNIVKRFAPGRVRVVVADDVPEIRALVRLRLQLDARFEVVGEAADGAQAVDVVAAEQPDAVVLDLQMPEVDGLGAIPGIKASSPRTKILVLSAFPDPYTLGHVLTYGADTYLDKGTALSELAPTLVSLCRPAA